MHHRGTIESSGAGLMTEASVAEATMTGSPGGPLGGKRILVVEDEYLIGAMVMEMLSASGAVIIGPATSLDAAVALASSVQLDAAVLDVNLRGERSDAVAVELARRGVPYLLATGYGEAGMPRAAQVLAKPFTEHRLLEALLQALQSTVIPSVQ